MSLRHPPLSLEVPSSPGTHTQHCPRERRRTPRSSGAQKQIKALLKSYSQAWSQTKPLEEVLVKLLVQVNENRLKWIHFNVLV